MKLTFRNNDLISRGRPATREYYGARQYRRDILGHFSPLEFALTRSPRHTPGDSAIQRRLFAPRRSLGQCDEEETNKRAIRK